MQKLFFQITIILALLFSGQVFGQKGLKLGAVVIPAWSNIMNPDDVILADENYNPTKKIPGFSAGAVLGWNPTDNFGIRLNLLYSDAGGRQVVREDFVNFTNYTTRLEYLKVPLMIGLHTNSYRRKLMFSFNVGGQVNYLVRASKFNDNPTFEPPLPKNITDYPDAYAQYNALSYSALADFGLDIYLVNDYKLNVHVRYEYGLTDIENKNASYRLTENGQTNEVLFYPRSRSATISSSLGLVFGLTRTFGRPQNVGIPGNPIP